MHVHAQAMMRIREQERREWLTKTERAREVMGSPDDDTPAIPRRRARVMQRLHHVAAMYRMLRATRRPKVA